MGFFGDFSLRARSKNPRGWGSGIWDPQKSPVKNPQNIPNPGDGDLGFFRLKIPKNLQSQGWEFGIFEARKIPEKKLQIIKIPNPIFSLFMPNTVGPLILCTFIF